MQDLAPMSTETLDGQMLLVVGNDGQFARFCEAAGKPEWAQDARFATNTLRVKHREVLIPLLQTVTRTRSTAQWISLLEDKAVPCGPINDMAQAFADAQVQARCLVVKQPLAQVQQEQEAIENIATVASPLRLQSTPPVLRRAPPSWGSTPTRCCVSWGWMRHRLSSSGAPGWCSETLTLFVAGAGLRAEQPASPRAQ
ncbi:MAG: L-carnitine dehydratase/bile acid-inducible protein F [Comamonadaceae bacterium]|nr:MAG: L-carnitine dehydratase/bile acid-inducible protein F [Comamonadaceae bacterium]